MAGANPNPDSNSDADAGASPGGDSSSRAVAGRSPDLRVRPGRA